MARIAIVSPDPTNNAQGVERFCHLLARALAEAGHTTEVVPPRKDAVRGADLVITNALVSVRTDVPRIHVYHGCAVPQVSRSHAEASRRWRAKFMISCFVREFVGGLGAARVSVSEQCAAEVHRWYRMPSDVITNGVDTAIFKPKPRDEARREIGIAADRRVALYIGRPEWRKRPDIALRAANEEGYELFVASYRGYPGAEWIGSLSPEQTATWIAAADVVLMPTQYEACSFALLECLAVGTPTVTTSVGWTPELLRAVPSYSTLVSQAGDYSGFRSALATVSSAGSAVTAASEYVRSSHNLRAFSADWTKFVERILSENAVRPTIG